MLVERRRHDLRTPLGAARFPIVECAALTDPVECAERGSEGRHDVALRDFVSRVLADPSVSVRTEGGTFPLASVVRLWRGRHHLNVLPHVRTVWAPLALLQVHGRHPGEVVGIAARGRKEHRWVVPRQPPARFCSQRFAAADLARLWVHLGAQVPGRTSKPRLGKTKVRGCCNGYEAGHLLRALQASQHLRRQAALPDTAVACVSFVDPSGGDKVLSDARASGLEIPAQQTLRRARLRLDAARCMWERRVRARVDHVRCVAIDASPVAGRELLACRSELVPAAALDVERPDLSTVRVSTHPLCQLGHGRAGAHDKAAAFLHGLALEDGPSAFALRRALMEVRSFLSDLGVEACLPDTAVSVETFLHHTWRNGRMPTRDGEPAANLEALRPFALPVAGWNHIVDWVGKAATTRLPFWPSWLDRVRAVIRLLQQEGVRDRLRQILLEVSTATGDVGAADLQRFSASFASWRWESLFQRTRELLRVERSLRAAWAAVASGAVRLPIREDSLRTTAHEAIMSAEWWRQCHALHRLHGPVEGLRRWGTGCPCHTEVLVSVPPCLRECERSLGARCVDLFFAERAGGRGLA